MSVRGRLIWKQEGYTQRLKIHPNLSFNMDELSRPLRDLYENEQEKKNLDSMEVEYERGKAGKIIRVRQKGTPWEDPTPPDVQAPLNNMPVIQGGGITVADVAANNREMTLSNGTRVRSNKIAICEIALSRGALVQQQNGKWIRTDYTQDNRYCYPFNFVRAQGGNSKIMKDDSAEKRLCSPLNDCSYLDQSRYKEDSHTGHIDVELTVLTPTIVSHPVLSDHLLDEANKKQMQAVYVEARNNNGRYGETKITESEESPGHTQRIRPSAQMNPGKFVIPATSLKGMLRSMVEAYSNSFMGVISSSLKGNENEGKAGIKHRNDWRCSDAGVARDNRTLYTYSWDCDIPSPLPPDEGKDGNWLRWVENGNTPWDKLQHLSAEMHPERTSLACQMFGRVGKDANYPSWAGRIRVSTAESWDEDGHSTAYDADNYWFLKTQTRPSGAKAKCEALYLLPNNGPCPNIGHCNSINAAGAVPGRYPHDPRRTNRATSGCDTAARYCNPDSQSRGRKMYWPHSLGDMPLTTVRDILKDKSVADAQIDMQLKTAISQFAERVKGHPKAHADSKSWVRPVLPGSRFRFRIAFTNLTTTELGALLKSIELENQNHGALETATHCHRVGRAKALGFGSVLLSIQGIRFVDIKNAYGSLVKPDDIWKEDVNVTEKAIDDFKEACAQWSSTAWVDIEALTRLPRQRTDYEYWKNFSDFNPEINTQNPLPLPLDQVQA